MDMTEEGYWYLDGRDHKCRLTSYSAQDIHVFKMSIAPKSRNPVIKGTNGRKKGSKAPFYVHFMGLWTPVFINILNLPLFPK